MGRRRKKEHRFAKFCLLVFVFPFVLLTVQLWLPIAVSVGVVVGTFIALKAIYRHFTRLDLSHHSRSQIAGIKVFYFPVGEHAYETEWIRALATAMRATAEVRIPHGRVDVLSNKYAVEVDRLGKWHDAMGQSQHYAHATGRSALVAFIIPTVVDEKVVKKLRHIKSIYDNHQIAVVLLRSSLAA